MRKMTMIEYGIYFGKEEFYQLIRNVGGEWNDSKERPIVCMFKSTEVDGLYWAIPLGKWDHRSKEAKDRINRYMRFDDDDIRSCFYHVGNTDVKSIFFISDAVPITERYIEREYINRHTSNIHIIKNEPLITELERKLRRILSYEQSRNNYFRQHITDVKKHLIEHMSESTGDKSEQKN